jgi:hypothetical protein
VILLGPTAATSHKVNLLPLDQAPIEINNDLLNNPYFNLYESANYWLTIQSFVAGAGAEVQPLFSRRSRNFTQKLTTASGASAQQLNNGIKMTG